MWSGAWPFVVSILAPISRSGAAIRSIGRCESDSSPVEHGRLRLAGEHACEEAHQRARVLAVDRAALQAAEADAVDAKVVVSFFLHFRAEGAHRLDGRHRVGGAAEAAHERLPFADRAEEDGAVRDRLVAGHGDVAVDFCRRLYTQEGSA